MAEYFAAACNSIKAGWWELTFAKLLGKKFVGVDEWAGKRQTITCYIWRGKMYMTDTRCDDIPRST